MLLEVSLAFAALRTYSADINVMRIQCKSGADVTILLDEKPVICFYNPNLVILTD